MADPAEKPNWRISSICRLRFGRTSLVCPWQSWQLAACFRSVKRASDRLTVEMGDGISFNLAGISRPG